jgi:hypothetical protein
MGDSRRALLKFVPAALAAGALRAEQASPHPQIPAPGDKDDTLRLPDGRDQRLAMIQADYKANLKDARELIDLTQAFELNLEKSDANVLSLDLLKKLDDIDKISKRIRGRMRH